ncbi:MAG: hypothetical protein ACJASN_002733, partial [Cyclobacteriaceae bacterium]
MSYLALRSQKRGKWGYFIGPKKLSKSFFRNLFGK